MDCTPYLSLLNQLILIAISHMEISVNLARYILIYAFPGLPPMARTMQ